jgi:nitrate/nitrite transport system permease protein
MTVVRERLVKNNRENKLLDNENVRALLLFLLSLGLFLLFWEMGAKLKWFGKGVPTASLTIQELWYWVSHPFYNNGPNDLGIGWNLLISLRRVAIGYTIASVIAVPLGILVGISQVAFKAFNPYFQLLKPVSPLAWLPKHNNFVLPMWRSTKSTIFSVT